MLRFPDVCITYPKLIYGVSIGYLWLMVGTTSGQGRNNLGTTPFANQRLRGQNGKERMLQGGKKFDKVGAFFHKCLWLAKKKKCNKRTKKRALLLCQLCYKFMPFSQKQMFIHRQF